MDELKAQLKRLYLSSFEDGQEYADFYFEHKYDPANVVYREDNGTVISALHLMPRKIYLHGGLRDAALISAAATLPQFRGRGIMADVLADAFKRLEQRGTEYCVLHPFSNSYYYRYGFFDYTFVQFKAVKGTGGAVLQGYSPQHLGIMTEIYNQYCSQYEGWLARDNRQMRIRVEDALVGGNGIAALIMIDNKYMGYVVIEGGAIEEYCFRGGVNVIDCVEELRGMSYPVHKDSRAQNTRPYAMMKVLGKGQPPSNTCILWDKY